MSFLRTLLMFVFVFFNTNAIANDKKLSEEIYQKFLKNKINFVSKLPKCYRTTGYLDKCWAITSYVTGKKYIGEWSHNTYHGHGILILPDGTIKEGNFRRGKFYNEVNKFVKPYQTKTVSKIITNKPQSSSTTSNITIKATKPKNTKPSISSAELEKERAKRLEEERKRKALEQKLASFEQEKQKRLELEKKLAALQSEKKKQIKNVSNEIGSGFYVSKFRHIVTNQHVVNKCNKITVGDSISKQIPATLIASDKRNDLAILQTISMEMASADTKSFIQNLSIEIVPIVSGGLIRAEDVIGGEEIFVAGYPLGSMVSDSMRLVPGLVNATKGYENDITQFETDASIRKGNSGGPIYDKRGNIVGVAVKRLNVSQSDNFNFAIKGTTVKQFLDANGVITSLANRKLQMSSTDIYKIASKQTVMVVCHR